MKDFQNEKRFLFLFFSMEEVFVIMGGWEFNLKSILVEQRNGKI